MYTQGVFTYAPWYVIDPNRLTEFWWRVCRYQCLGNHDIVPGQPGVDFQTKVAPMYDDRWYFVSLITWSLDFVSFLMRSRELSSCRIIPTTSSAPIGQRPSSLSTQTASSPAIKKSSSLPKLSCCTNKHTQNTSVYRNTYTSTCYNDTQTQVDFLSTTFSASKATWKFLQLHHPYSSVSTNETDLAPLIEVVIQHQGIVINGHDHCMGHFYQNNTNFILSGAAGYPQAGDCNNGIALGPYALYLGANNLTGKFEW